MDLGIPGLGPAIRIGIGGSAIVYRARQEKLHRDVAIKLLTNQDPAFVRRFEREAKMLGQLSRLPGIVTIHDSGFTTNDEPYLVLEYCPSSLLNRVYRDGPYRPEPAAAIMASVAATVAEAHTEGIIHRDLKPANILLTDADEPLISDFGISSVLGATGNMSTSVGFTPGYVAPETLTGQQGDAAVDVYALGATLFHIITGHAPFMGSDGDGSNLLALANRIDSEPVPDLRPDGVPDEICAAIEWAMAKDPSDRPSSQQLADRLGATGTGTGTGTATTTATATKLDGPYRPPTPTPDASPGRPVEPSHSAPLAPPPPRPATDAPRPAGVDPVLVNREAVGKGSGKPAAVASGFEPPPPPPLSGAGVPVVGGPKRSSAQVLAALAIFVLGVGVFALNGAGSSNDFDDPEFFATTTTSVPYTTTGPYGTTSAVIDGGLVERPSSVTGYQDRWAAERAQIVFGLTDQTNQYGLGEDGVLRGPAGFEIDTADCPADWQNSPSEPLEGASPEESTIRLGFMVPADGYLKQPLIRGMRAYFDWVNESGGIGPDGAKIETVVLPSGPDDQGRTDPGLEVVDVHGLLSMSTMTTSTGLAVYDDLNESCIPHPFAAGPHPAWADPTGHPWTTGLERSYRSEATAWVKLVESYLGQPGQVAILVADREFGDIYLDGFRAAAADSTQIASIETATADPSLDDSSLSREMDRLLSAEPDVFIAITSGEGCEKVISGAAQMGTQSFVELAIINTACGPSERLASVMDHADGWLLASDGIQATMVADYWDSIYPPGFEYNSFVDFADNRLSTTGRDPGTQQHGIGFGLYGWAYHQALEIAARLPGGVNRTNFVLAQRAMSDMTVPIGTAGIGFGMEGNDDAYFLEDHAILRFSSPDGFWLPEQVFELDGGTPSCSWQSTGRCAP